MRGQHEMPTASVVRSSQATPARRRGHLCTAFNLAAFHLSSPDSCSNDWGHLSRLGQSVAALRAYAGGVSSAIKLDSLNRVLRFGLETALPILEMHRDSIHIHSMSFV